MLFNSTQFIVFFILVISIYYLLPYKYRWPLLLVSSYYFYMAWKPHFILLIIFSTLIDYYIALRMGKLEKKDRKKYLYISIFVNLGLLFFFKYLAFFNTSLASFLMIFNIGYPLPTTLKILLPMGISFYTFQTMSYTIDVYRGKIEPEKNIGIFALYVTFFPQLVAGPIERSDRLLPQLKCNHDFDFQKFTRGIKIMLMGFFKKVVIADRVAVVVNRIYDHPMEFGGSYIIIGTLLFAFQIYCDFSGYSDIAIGSAKVMGIDLMENFKRPYFATSIQEFWKRWHISLTTWFKDYVYIPLGGNRVSVPRQYMNIFIIFLISGLWHGANWTFIIWGCIHGFYQVFGRLTRPFRSQLIRILRLDVVPFILNIAQGLITFVLVSFAWIFFRAESLRDALYMSKTVLRGEWLIEFKLFEVVLDLGVSLFDTLLIFISILLLLLLQLWGRKESIHDQLMRSHSIVRWAFYYVVLIMVLVMGVFYDANGFIYFQF